jgi:hypothetical protein
MGDVAALLGGADELLDRRIEEVEQWAVRQGLGKRPVLNNVDRLLFVWLCRLVQTTLTALAVVSTETVACALRNWECIQAFAIDQPE